MTKKLICLFIASFLFLYSCSPKQADKDISSTNDSIQKYLDLGGNDTLNFKIRDNYNDIALSFIDLNKNDTLTRFYLSSISFNYMRIRNWNSLKKIGKIYFEKSKAKNDTLNLARYYRYRASYFKNNQIYDSAFYYYIKSEKFYKKTKDKFGLALVYLNKSFVQRDINDYLGAEISSLKSYSFFKNKGNNVHHYEALNQLGLIYIELDEFDKALRCFNKVLTIATKSNIKNKDEWEGICMSNIGFVYQKQGKWEKAISQYKETLEKIKNIKNYKELYSNTVDNLVSCKIAINDFKKLPELLFESLKIRKEINDSSSLIISLFHVSDYYHIIGKPNLAEKYALEALKIAKQSKSKLDYLIALKLLTKVNRNYIPKYFEEYIKVNESFQVSERKARNNFARIQLETNEIKEEKETAVKQKTIITGIAGVIILIIILLLIISQQRSKQKELRLLQSQQKANEEIYDLMLLQKSKEEFVRQSEKKRIALELHDGVMNKLASTRLNLNILSHKNDKQTIKKCLIHIEEIYQIEQEIRSIAHDLNIEIFNGRNSFIILLNDFITTQNNTYNSHYQIEVDEAIDWNNLSSGLKINLYRIIQEASHNINKFAQAKNAIISLILDNSNLCLSITDDGKGFDIETKKEGIGLKNIGHRVEMLNGRFFIQSINNKKTSLNISIPIS